MILTAPTKLSAVTVGLLILLIVGCREYLPSELAKAYAVLPEKIDFNFHVKPILSDKCFSCHGPDAANRKAGLRLDTPEGAYAELPENPGVRAIVPSNLHKSALFHRIISDDAEQIMPPPESKLSLTNEEKAVLLRWIKEGAAYQPHWAFIPPKKASSPKVQNEDWPENEIDNFILARLQEEGLTPGTEADKRTLIRRLSFDLRGLPPSKEEIDLFLSDNSPDAYTTLVDQFLASPAYGERMAMDWMDVARYADSDGYLDDKHRDFTPWRDWVIRAFNTNLPYDQFVTWQLAGDLLPNATQEQILATAFNRLHRKNSEAGIVFEEYRVEYVADRTNTLGKAFLGLTMECARCHDHKYDPISQQDYYRTFAFFNSTNEMGTAVYGPNQTPGPSLLLSTEDQSEIIAFLERKIAQQSDSLQRLLAVPDPAMTAWAADEQAILRELDQQQKNGLQAELSFDDFKQVDEKHYSLANSVKNTKPVTVKEPVIAPGSSGNGLFFNTYTSLKLPDKIGWFDRTDPFSISLSVYPDTIYSEAGLFFHCEDIRLGYKGYSMHLEDNHLKFIMAYSYPQNAIQVRSPEPLPVKAWTVLTLTYDGSSRADGIHLYWNGEEVPLQIDYDHLYKGILYEPDIHTYGFAGFQLGERNFIKIMKKGGVDELRIYDRPLTALEVLYQYDREMTAKYLQTADDPGAKALLQTYYQQHHQLKIIRAQAQLRSTRCQLNDTITPIKEIMVMGDLPEARPTFVLQRGLYSAPGEAVQPGVPERLLPYPDELPSNRLGLSQWLFQAEHPLTARVFVNRIWQMHFGTGIVRTAEDFGSQGALPSHPELLDWLAVDFMESDWDIKALHRKIVLSATYRQSSRQRPELQVRDPNNQLLARGPSFRLPAEMIRDNALAVSGLLVARQGGPSTYPYQPEGLWDEISNKSWRYPYLQKPGEGLYRRSLYTIFKRTAPPPSMLIFDASDRSACTVRRERTNTPLRALVLLNDPQYLEAARVLAEKELRADVKDIQGRLGQGFALITGHPPDPRELDLLMQFFREELNEFTQHPQKTLDYLSTGEMLRDEELPPEQTAAMASVLHAVMNTAEAYTRY
ncbi:MAG: DUF1553 domain-containing protein [Lewinella sp.]|nr:DUF1553 domain-containing protein [Lewinella sp.]